MENVVIKKIDQKDFTPGVYVSEAPSPLKFLFGLA